MNQLIIPNRQQRRAEKISLETAAAFQAIHLRLNVSFECMRMLGLTEEQLIEAQENINARLKLGVQ